MTTTTTVSAISTARVRIIGSAPIPTQSLAACYALRKLVAAYAGPCLQIRRSSDSALIDIGFDVLDRLDTKALLAFVGTTGDGFVVTWYDQSGGGKHAIQATAGTQPRVVIGGVLQMDGGWPSIDFPGTPGTVLRTATSIISPNDAISLHTVATGGTLQTSGGSSLRNLLSHAESGFGVGGLSLVATRSGQTQLGLGSANAYQTSTLFTSGRHVISGSIVPGATYVDVYMFLDGSSLGIKTSTSTKETVATFYRSNFAIGGEVVGVAALDRTYTGRIQEVIVYQADTRSDRAAIEAVQSSFSGHKAAYVPKIQRLLGETYDSVFAICEILEKLAPVSTQPRVSASSLRINGSDFGVYEYVVKRGMNVSLGTFVEPAFFSSQRDTRAAFIILDGNLTIPVGITFIPAVRKLFCVLYVTGNLVLNGTISMTARGANHSGTGDSGGYVAPQAIRIASSADIQEENPNLGSGNAGGYEITQSSAYSTYTASKAFNKTNVDYLDCWISAWVGFVAPQWLQIKYPATTYLVRHSVTSRNYGSDLAYPIAFSVLGSTDGVTFTEIPGSSQSGLTWGTNETKTFSVNSAVAYTYYRLNITQSYSVSYVVIGEWKLFTSAPNPEIPAAGGAGADAVSARAGSYSTNGLSGGVAFGGCGGGGGGGARSDWIAGTHFGGGGSAGTAFGGGCGGGGVWANDGAFVGGSGGANGGAGGGGVRNQRIATSLTLADGSGLGGAGNNGGASQGPRTTSLSTDGTGGTLIVFVKGSVSGSGSIQSNGVRGGQYTGGVADSWGTSGGGGSGGGSVTLVSGSGNALTNYPQANGGALASFTGVRGGSGGAGGSGSARTFLLPQGSSLTTRVPRPVPTTQTSLAFARILRQFQLESTVACAFGLRKLVWNYAGPLVRLRNSLNAELDIYADSQTGLLDSNAATTHANGGTLYVVTWYDQSGLSRHATQTTPGKQPVMDLSATMVTFNALSFTNMTTNFGATIAQPTSHFAVHSTPETSSAHAYMTDGLTGSTRQAMWFTSDAGVVKKWGLYAGQYQTTSDSPPDPLRLMTGRFNGTSSYVKFNGIVQTNFPSPNQTQLLTGLTMGSRFGPIADGDQHYLTGNVREYVVCYNVTTGQEAALERGLMAQNSLS